MKKTTKRMIISVLTLVLTVAALGTTTFAWFSLSTTSNVSNIEGTVTGGEGLEVRIVGPMKTTNWMANIDVKGQQVFDSLFRFDAVTTNDASTWNFTKMAQDEEGNILLNQAAVLNSDYLEFEIQLRSQLGGTVQLTGLTFGGSSVDFVNDGENYYQYNESVATNHTVKTKVAYSARISFTEVLGLESTGGNWVYQYGGADGVLGPVDDGLGNVTVQGNYVMGTTGVAVGQWSYLTHSRGLTIFYEDPLNPDNLIPYTPGEAQILAAYTDIRDESNNLRTVVNLVPGVGGENYYGARLKVRIWVEGWDADAYDSIYNAVLNINLIFQKPTLTPQDLYDNSVTVLQEYLNTRSSVAGTTINLPATINGYNVTWTVGGTPNTTGTHVIIAGENVITGIIEGNPNTVIGDQPVSRTIIGA